MNMNFDMIPSKLDLPTYSQYESILLILIIYVHEQAYSQSQ